MTCASASKTRGAVRVIAPRYAAAAGSARGQAGGSGGTCGPGRGIAGDGGPCHGARFGVVVVRAVVLHRDVVPEGDGAGLPVDAGLQLGKLGVTAQEVEERAALGRTETDDLAGEEAVDEQGRPSGAGVADDDGVFDGGDARADPLEPVTELVGVGADAPVVDRGQ